MKFGMNIMPLESRYSSVGILTGYGQEGLGSIPVSARLFSSPNRLDRPWDPPSLISNGYREALPLVVKQ
jgi:hypothetical protein